jgi:hypothetical protein
VEFETAKSTQQQETYLSKVGSTLSYYCVDMSFHPAVSEHFFKVIRPGFQLVEMVISL